MCVCFSNCSIRAWSILAACFFTSGCAWLGPVVDAPVSDNFDGREFHYYGERTQEYLPEIVVNYFLQLVEIWPQAEEFALPATPDRVEDGELLVTWVNHSTLLVQMDGYNFLTDPVWSDCVGPFRLFSVCRYHPPGIPFEQLPEIDAVIVSHAHYDHLDLPTLQRLYEEHDPLFITALGNGELIEQTGSDRIRELDWWQSVAVPGGAEIVAVPARHWSRRGLVDTNRRLWMGAVIKTGNTAAYFAGDTGYGDFLEEIRDRFSPIDLALLPIGDHQPRWLVNGRHMNPEEAVQASQLLGAKTSIGMHFYTFKLSYGDRTAPLDDLRLALQKRNLPEDRFIAPVIGKTYRLHENRRASHETPRR